MDSSFAEYRNQGYKVSKRDALDAELRETMTLKHNILEYMSKLSILPCHEACFQAG